MYPRLYPKFLELPLSTSNPEQLSRSFRQLYTIPLFQVFNVQLYCTLRVGSIVSHTVVRATRGGSVTVSPTDRIIVRWLFSEPKTWQVPVHFPRICPPFLARLIYHNFICRHVNFFLSRGSLPTRHCARLLTSSISMQAASAEQCILPSVASWSYLWSMSRPSNCQLLRAIFEHFNSLGSRRSA